jgi:hypothetical protein
MFAEEMPLIPGCLLAWLEWNALGIEHPLPNFGHI